VVLVACSPSWASGSKKATKWALDSLSGLVLVLGSYVALAIGKYPASQYKTCGVCGDLDLATGDLARYLL
jgi:hypothetical protein